MHTRLPLLLALLCLAAHAQVAVTVKETRGPVTGDPKREGLQAVKRSLVLGNASFQYEQTVDPTQGDKTVWQQYGDYRLGCAFPGGWNWDLEYFLDVQVTRPGEQPFIANRAMLQEGIYALQQGRRGVAEMVWPLPAGEGAPEQPGKLAVRFVKTAEEANWFYVEARLDGEPEAQITQVRVGSYPFITTGPPERQRWVSTLAGAHRMTDAPTPLDPATEWGMALHNKLAHEEGGCLFVFDPDQVRSASAAGTYCVGVTMDTRPGVRSVHLALGYFWDELYVTAVERFRKEARQVLDRLRTLDWSAAVDLAHWEKVKAEVEALLQEPDVREQCGADWQALVSRIERAAGATREGGPAARGSERELAQLLAEAKALKDRVYGAALAALLK